MKCYITWLQQFKLTTTLTNVCPGILEEERNVIKQSTKYVDMCTSSLYGYHKYLIPAVSSPFSSMPANTVSLCIEIQDNQCWAEFFSQKREKLLEEVYILHGKLAWIWCYSSFWMDTTTQPHTHTHTHTHNHTHTHKHTHTHT